MLTKRQRHPAPLDFFSAASPAIRVYKQTKLCNRNKSTVYSLTFSCFVDSSGCTIGHISKDCKNYLILLNYHEVFWC